MRLVLLIIIVILTFVCGVPAHSAEIPNEKKLKAAYLYNFVKFIHWPESSFSGAQAPLVIGLLGPDDFNGELLPLEAKQVRNRSIEIRYFRTAEEIRSCHLLYISPTESETLEKILEKLSGKAILTVGDDNNFAAQGGVIQFVWIRDRLRFVINLEAAKAKQIQIDSQLLSLASEVLDTKK